MTERYAHVRESMFQKAVKNFEKSLSIPSQVKIVEIKKKEKERWLVWENDGNAGSRGLVVSS